MSLLQRKRLHKLLDQLPDDQLTNIERAIEHTLEHGVAVPFLQGIPVYELDNTEHMKIISEMPAARPEPPKRVK